MADGNRLRNEILAYFHQNPSRPIRTVELTRKLRREKRTVNYHLYALQRQGAIRKVVVSPPTWCLETANPAIRYVLPPDGDDPQELGWEADGDGEAAVNGESQESPTAEQPGLTAQDVNNRILQMLSAQGAMGATDLAKALGFHSKKDVNPYLYELQLKGLIKKVQDSPPLWEAADSSAALLERLNDLTLNEHSPELGPAMGLDPTVLTQRLLARLAELDRPIEVDQLALDVGLRSKKDINPVLYSLLRQGRVQKIQDVPPMWALNPDPSMGRTLSRSTSSAESNGLEASGGDSSSSSNGGGGGGAGSGGEEPLEDGGEQPASIGLGRTASTASLNSIQSQPKPPDSGSETEGGPSSVHDNGEGSPLQQPIVLVAPVASAGSSTTDLTAPSYSDQEMREMVLDHMGKAQKKTVSALEMARAFGLPNKKAVNRALYYLKRQGLVSKVSIKPALWSLGNVTPAAPLNTLHPFSETELNSIEEMRDSKMALGALKTAHSKDMLNTNPFFQQLQKIANRDSENAKVPGSIATKDGLNSGLQPNADGENEGSVLLNSGSFNTDDPTGVENMAAILNSDTFAALNKNPISAFMEYAQSRHLEGKIEIVCCTGPSHNPRFQAAAFLGTQAFPPVWDKTKKEAKRKAADVAIRMLNAQGAYQLPVQTKNATRPTDITPTTTMFDLVAALSHQAYNEKVVSIPEPMLAGRKVLAAMVMKQGDDAGTVISMGTGNRCISGERLSQEGLVVNDSHAEIVTRRGLLRFLYKQLNEYDANDNQTIFDPTENGKLRIKPNITFHLYISTAPCGDGALFSKTDSRVTDNNGDEGEEHRPTFSTDLQGLLRTKMEGGEGTIPIEPDFTTQTWDGIMRGDQRLRTMSCSDKIARWNVLGLQGALLTHFLEPIYLTSVTLGYLYDHGHLARAVCCRLNGGEPELDSLLPPGYRLNHPRLGRVSIYDPPRETEKTKPHSLNWCLGDQRLELTDGTKGQCVMRSIRDEQGQQVKRAASDKNGIRPNPRVEQKSQSQVCKAVMYATFKEVCAKLQRTDLLEYSNYYLVKMAATDFQKAKKVLQDRFRQKGRGTWISKPMEEKMFSCIAEYDGSDFTVRNYVQTTVETSTQVVLRNGSVVHIINDSGITQPLRKCMEQLSVHVLIRDHCKLFQYSFIL